jgi:hypothetical protein
MFRDPLEGFHWSSIFLPYSEPAVLYHQIVALNQMPPSATAQTPAANTYTGSAQNLQSLRLQALHGEGSITNLERS